MTDIDQIREAAGQNLFMFEMQLGTRIVSRQWCDPDWTDRTIISQHGDQIRLVALEAKRPLTGAMGRLVEKILKAGLTPVMVEPNDLVEAWCQRRHWRRRRIGQGRMRHEIWYPR
jgi:hypothetical protein